MVEGSGGGVLGPVTLVATGMVRTNFAGPHLWSAARFARQAHGLEQQGLAVDNPPSFYDEAKAYVVACVMLSVASAEAWAGEIAADPAQYFPGNAAAPAAMTELVKWSSVSRKYKELARLAGDSAFDVDEPMRDLILLRNKLVHFHAEYPDARDVHQDVEDRIKVRFTRSPLLHGSAPLFPDAVASYACARWCVETARGFIEAFARARGWTHPWTKPVHVANLELPTCTP